MITKEAALLLAHEWVEAWNSHDLERILEHYAEEIVLTSPVVIERLGEANGTVRGKAALRDYFRRGLEAYPKLRFELKDVMWGVSSVVLYYANQRGSMTGEVMEIDSDGKVKRVLANYSG
jgi:ketosteroid isomerase-like protein